MSDQGDKPLNELNEEVEARMKASLQDKKDRIKNIWKKLKMEYEELCEAKIALNHQQDVTALCHDYEHIFESNKRQKKN